MSKELIDKINEALEATQKADDENREQALKTLVGSINEVTSAFEDYIKEFEGYKIINKELSSASIKLTDANVKLVQTIKSIHIILGQHRNRFNNKKFKDMPELMAELDAFVLSPAAITAGVVTENKKLAVEV